MGDMPKMDVVAMLRVKELGDKIDRLSEVIERLDQHLMEESCACGGDSEIATLSGKADGMVVNKTISLQEAVTMSIAYLVASDKACALMRYGGRWSHFSDRGDVVGAWETIEEAQAATKCDSQCSRDVFPSVTT